MTYIIFTSMLLALTVVAVFIPRMPAALIAYAAMWLSRIGGIAAFSNASMIFWGVATALVIANNFLLPRHIVTSRVAVPYIGLGAVTGTVLGMLTNMMAGIIVGALFGAFFGAIVYANTARGREVMHFPSGKFFNYLGAKGIPVAVAMCMAGACLIQLLYPLS